MFALAFALMGCGGDGEPAETADAPGTRAETAPQPALPALSTPDTSGAGDARPLNLIAVNNSGVAGEATIAPRGNETQVILRLDQAPANATLQAHVHRGTCEAGGPVVVPLEPVATNASGAGVSTSVVAQNPETVMNGEHFVQAHEPGGNPGAPVACANIPPLGSGATM